MPSVIQITPIKSFKDNYIWAIINRDNHTACIVDPGDSAPVIAFLNEEKLQLSAIMITHHHNDHCGGVAALQTEYAAVTVYGPKHNAILATTIVADKQTITLAGCHLRFKVLAIPGHTLEHVAYYCAEAALVFCGDTLFSAGCGRIFEGTATQMYTSLMAIADLPEDTKLYCGHEYTLANLLFAQEVEKYNSEVSQYLSWVQQCHFDNQPSLPSTLAVEKKINPFLRAEVDSVIVAASVYAKQPLTTPVSVFGTTRMEKQFCVAPNFLGKLEKQFMVLPYKTN